MLEKLEEITAPLPWINNHVKFFAVIVLAVISYYLIKNIIIPIIRKAVKSTSSQVDDVILSRKALKKISLFVPLFIFDSFAYLEPSIQSLLSRLVSILFIINFTLLVGTILSGINELYEKNEKYKERPIKGYIQTIKIVIYILGTMMIAGIILGRSPLEIIAGLGVFAAILALLFRDIILSFVASIQISSNDLVRVGDWIEVSKYGADGEVADISLTVIKVQNWDKTITTIPTYKLIEDSFKNWRGMRDSGVRRIKRSINIDQSSIKFCQKELLSKFAKNKFTAEYIKGNTAKTVQPSGEKTNESEENKFTNIGVFRFYLKKYLSGRDDLDRRYDVIVRQLPSGPEGVPIEIYAFANTTDFIKYENTQAEIFDHVLAVLPQFELNVFQHPTGNDFKNVLKTD